MPVEHKPCLFITLGFQPKIDIIALLKRKLYHFCGTIEQEEKII